MQEDKDGLAIPTSGAKSLLLLWLRENEYLVEDIEFINTPSAHMIFNDLHGLGSHVIHIENKDYDCIVINQGTDSM